MKLLKEKLVQLREWRGEVVMQEERHRKALAECEKTIKEYDEGVDEEG